jgi:hypothetical protein
MIKYTSAITIHFTQTEQAASGGVGGVAVLSVRRERKKGSVFSMISLALLRHYRREIKLNEMDASRLPKHTACKIIVFDAFDAAAEHWKREHAVCEHWLAHSDLLL